MCNKPIVLCVVCCMRVIDRDRVFIFGCTGPLNRLVFIANAELAVWFMQITWTRYHTGRNLITSMTLIDLIWKIYQKCVCEADILLAKDILYSFEVTLMSSYFSFLIYGSVWHLYENKHRKKIALSGTGKILSWICERPKQTRRKTFHLCSKEKMNLSLWAWWHRCQILSLWYSVDVDSKYDSVLQHNHVSSTASASHEFDSHRTFILMILLVILCEKQLHLIVPNVHL